MPRARQIEGGRDTLGPAPDQRERGGGSGGPTAAGETGERGREGPTESGKREAWRPGFCPGRAGGETAPPREDDGADAGDGDGRRASGGARRKEREFSLPWRRTSKNGDTRGTGKGEPGHPKRGRRG